MGKVAVGPAREFRPSPAIIRQARKITAKYSVVIEPTASGRFIGRTRELPGAIASGDTLAECARQLDFALETVVASYLVDGENPPAPVGREKRTEQVNVRFTRSERTLLDEESVRQGFRGIGDLIRAEMIRRLGPAAR